LRGVSMDECQALISMVRDARYAGSSPSGWGKWMHMMRRWIILTFAALTLTACASRNDIPVSSLGEDDDAICRANNVAVGSSDYVACRKNRDVQRGNAAARADRAQKNLSETMVNTPYKP
jgi:hypothetical protein